MYSKNQLPLSADGTIFYVVFLFTFTPQNLIYLVQFFSCSLRTFYKGMGHAVARSGKVTSSIPDGVTGIFHFMTVASTQPLTEMSIRNISWGIKAADA